MSNLVKKSKHVSTALLGAFLIAIVPTFGHADPPTFPTTLSQGLNCQVWDIAGTIVYSEDVPGVGTLTLTFVVATDDKGKIAGTGALEGTITDPDIGVIDIDLFDPQAKGKIKSSGTRPAKLQIKSKLAGTISGAGIVLAAKASVKVSGEVDTAGDFQGSGSIGLKAAGQKAKSKGPIALDVTPDPANDGTWDLNLNITSSDGVRLAGSGQAVLATGRLVEDLVAKGKYTVKRDISKVSLKNQAGAKVQFKNLAADATTETLTSGTMKYSLLGQKKSVEIATDCP